MVRQLVGCRSLGPSFASGIPGEDFAGREGESDGQLEDLTKRVWDAREAVWRAVQEGHPKAESMQWELQELHAAYSALLTSFLQTDGRASRIIAKLS